MGLLRSDCYVLAAIQVLNQADETVSVRQIAQLISYNPTTVSTSLRRLAAGGYLDYRRGTNRHWAYTILELPDEILPYVVAVKARRQ